MIELTRRLEPSETGREPQTSLTLPLEKRIRSRLRATLDDGREAGVFLERGQALRDGEPEELAQAMDEFYMPRFSGDQLPQSPTGIAISLAERIDTLVGIFGIGMKPTGDKDPFALRRAALGALRILREHALPLNLRELLEQARQHLGDQVTAPDTVQTVYAFMLERLKGLYVDAGTPLDVFEAVAAVQPDSIADFEHRVRAVSDFRSLPEAEALAAANKRIANILRQAGGEGDSTVREKLLEEPAEQALWSALSGARDAVAPMVDAREYTKALALLADLREPVDLFFDDVMVMTDDEAVRNNRLALLAELRALFLDVADISRLSLG